MRSGDLPTQIKLVCLSPYLSDYAAGHFYEYHRSLFLALSQEFDIAYVGSDFRAAKLDSDWYMPLFPKSLGKPIPRVTTRKLNQILEDVPAMHDSTSIYYVYEGSFYWLILGLKIVLRKPGSIFVINLFKSDRSVKRLTGRNNFFWRFAYSKVLQAGNGKILVSADNQKFFSKLNKILPQGYVWYLPLTPSLPRELKNIASGSKILIVIRGAKSRDMLQTLAPHLIAIENLFVHGLGRSDLDSMGLSHVSISVGNLNSAEYHKGYTELARCLFLYDISDFEYQSSARFIDCHYAGVPIMVSRDFSMAQEFHNCTLVHAFDDNAISAILSFIKSAASMKEHGCEDSSNRFLHQWSMIRHRISLDSQNSLRLSFPRKLLISTIASYQFVLSFCTLGGTINFLAIADEFRKFRKSNSV